MSLFPVKKKKNTSAYKLQQLEFVILVIWVQTSGTYDTSHDEHNFRFLSYIHSEPGGGGGHSVISMSGYQEINNLEVEFLGFD